MVSIGVLIQFTNDRSKIGRARYCKSRFKKSRANTNKMNFPTINERIVLKENPAAQQKTEGKQRSTADVDRI